MSTDSAIFDYDLNSCWPTTTGDSYEIQIYSDMLHAGYNHTYTAKRTFGVLSEFNIDLQGTKRSLKYLIDLETLADSAELLHEVFCPRVYT
jgi:hypothetical protein